MKRTNVFVACCCMALFSTTAFADVAGSNAATGSWTSTGSYSSTITLVDPGGNTSITDIVVGVNIDHTWSSDVSMTLSDGTTTVEFNDNQGDSSDYDSTNLGKYFWSDGGVPLDAIPAVIVPLGPPGFSTSNPLNGAFASSDATWTLTITDTTGGDGGFINGWNLNVATAAGPVVPEPTSIAILGVVGSLALIRRRRR